MAFECFATARYCGNNHTSFDLDLLPSCFTITISIDNMHDYIIHSYTNYEHLVKLAVPYK